MAETDQLDMDDDLYNFHIARKIVDGDRVLYHGRKVSKQDGDELACVTLVQVSGEVVDFTASISAQYIWPTASGRSMVDGPREIEDLSKTASNKSVVRSFVDNILQSGQADKVTQYISTSQYDQHNPDVEDGLAGFGKHLQEVMKSGLISKYVKVHQLVGQGNFVAILSHVELGDDDWAFVDIFRLKDGLILEHWDVQEKLGPKGSWITSRIFNDFEKYGEKDV